MKPFSRVFKDYREAGTLESLVSVDTLLDERTFLTKSGDLLTVLKADPPDYECLDPEQLDHVARRFEAAVRTLGEPFRIYQYWLKRQHPGLTYRHYADPVVERAVTNRAEYFAERAASLYSLDTYVVVVYTGWRSHSTRSRTGFISRAGSVLRRSLSTTQTVGQLEEELDVAARRLAETVDSFVVQCRDVFPLAVSDHDEAFRFLRRLLNYSPEKSEAGRLAFTSHVGFQAADSALECHRDHLRLGDEYVQVLTMKVPPAQTVAHFLRDVEELRVQFVMATEWQRIDNAQARRLLQSKRRHFHTAKASVVSQLTGSSHQGPKDVLVDDAAVAFIEDLGACLEEIEVRGKALGSFSLTIVLHAKDLAAVRRATAECFKVLAAQDARVIEERYNLLNAWLAVLPGNDAYNVRRLWILDSNYADLSLLFGHRTGDTTNRHLGAEYLAVLETEGGTPYHLNSHYGDVAHTFVSGTTGSGKSFLLNVLVTNLKKYDPVVFILDLGGNYRSLTRLFGGSYCSLAQGAARGTINPFCLPPTRENVHFLASFCRALIESGGYAMTAADEKDLFEQIDNVYALEPDQRRLLTLSLITNRDIRAQLAKWVQGGPYGPWFDNVSDTVSLASFQAFDFEGLGDYPQALEPLVFYILHRANSFLADPAFATTFKVFVMDEAWRFFRHPAIKAYVIEALKTWRKKNAAMILATQSVDDLRQSELLPVVLESCATQLFLANPGMDRDLYRELFHLNHTEVSRIASLVPKRQFLIKRPDLAKVLTLNVDARSFWLYTNNPSDNARKEEVFERHGLDQGLEILTRSHA